LEARISNRLKELREAQGLSLVALAERIGTSSQQVSHLELGKRHLTVEWLTRLAEALACHPWEIVSDPCAIQVSKHGGAIVAFQRLPQAPLVPGSGPAPSAAPQGRRRARTT
jgi:transcriptional regulator with XRE-family HTH domain